MSFEKAQWQYDNAEPPIITTDYIGERAVEMSMDALCIQDAFECGFSIPVDLARDIALGKEPVLSSLILAMWPRLREMAQLELESEAESAALARHGL